MTAGRIGAGNTRGCQDLLPLGRRRAHDDTPWFFQDSRSSVHLPAIHTHTGSFNAVSLAEINIRPRFLRPGLSSRFALRHPSK